MNPIINQLAALIEPDAKENNAVLAAEKLVLFSGLSRGGFFRDCALIPDELLPGKSRKNNVIWFVNTAADEALSADVRKTVTDELKAFGVNGFFSKDAEGNDVVKFSCEDRKEQKLTWKICSCPGSSCPGKRSYSTAPLPFEILTVSEVATDSDVAAVLRTMTEQESKAKKAPQKSASNHESSGSLGQPSLFDL